MVTQDEFYTSPVVIEERNKLFNLSSIENNHLKNMEIKEIRRNIKDNNKIQEQPVLSRRKSLYPEIESSTYQAKSGIRKTKNNQAQRKDNKSKIALSQSNERSSESREANLPEKDRTKNEKSKEDYEFINQENTVFMTQLDQYKLNLSELREKADILNDRSIGKTVIKPDEVKLLSFHNQHEKPKEKQNTEDEFVNIQKLLKFTRSKQNSLEIEKKMQLKSKASNENFRKGHESNRRPTIPILEKEANLTAEIVEELPQKESACTMNNTAYTQDGMDHSKNIQFNSNASKTFQHHKKSTLTHNTGLYFYQFNKTDKEFLSKIKKLNLDLENQLNKNNSNTINVVKAEISEGCNLDVKICTKKKNFEQLINTIIPSSKEIEKKVSSKYHKSNITSKINSNDVLRDQNENSASKQNSIREQYKLLFEKKKKAWNLEDLEMEQKEKEEQERKRENRLLLNSIRKRNRYAHLYVDTYSQRDNKINTQILKLNKDLGRKIYTKKKLNKVIDDFIVKIDENIQVNLASFSKNDSGKGLSEEKAQEDSI